MYIHMFEAYIIEAVYHLSSSTLVTRQVPAPTSKWMARNPNLRIARSGLDFGAGAREYTTRFTKNYIIRLPVVSGGNTSILSLFGVRPRCLIRSGLSNVYAGQVRPKANVLLGADEFQQEGASWVLKIRWDYLGSFWVSLKQHTPYRLILIYIYGVNSQKDLG